MSALKDFSNVPPPVGATDVSDWADVGTPDQFRVFDGPRWTVPGLRFGYADQEVDAFITIFGTQLADGTIEGRCIRLGGVHWDDELCSETARIIGRSLLEAADELDRVKVSGE
ncbi:MAG: hypothetical protein QOC76_1387 [Mycobacterium sp.]|jgi:hypothetical protein|nr:hypothetical protein [Mycobacterium sp.]